MFGAFGLPQCLFFHVDRIINSCFFQKRNSEWFIVRPSGFEWLISYRSTNICFFQKFFLAEGPTKMWTERERRRVVLLWPHLSLMVCYCLWSQVGIYTRLWCVYEAYLGTQYGKTCIMPARPRLGGCSFCFEQSACHGKGNTNRSCITYAHILYTTFKNLLISITHTHIL